MTQSGDTYKPIDCGQHSEYELAIMHKSRLRLRWRDGEHENTDIVIPLDLITRNKQEFLVVRNVGNNTFEIRLDYITAVEQT